MAAHMSHLKSSPPAVEVVEPAQQDKGMDTVH